MRRVTAGNRTTMIRRQPATSNLVLNATRSPIDEVEGRQVGADQGLALAETYDRSLGNATIHGPEPVRQRGTIVVSRSAFGGLPANRLS